MPRSRTRTRSPPSRSVSPRRERKRRRSRSRSRSRERSYRRRDDRDYYRRDKDYDRRDRKERKSRRKRSPTPTITPPREASRPTSTNNVKENEIKNGTAPKPSTSFVLPEQIKAEFLNVMGNTEDDIAVNDSLMQWIGEKVVELVSCCYYYCGEKKYMLF